MTPIINPMWFYLMEISEGLKVFFGILGGLFLVFSFVGFIDGFDSTKKTLTKTVVIGAFSLLLCLATPTKETIQQMLVASLITENNINWTTDKAKNVIDYIVDSIDTLNEEGED